MTTLAKSLLKARYFGTREYKAHLSEHIKSKTPQIITVYGEPKKVVMEYDQIMDLIDWYEELQDRHLMEDITQARQEYQGNPGKVIPAEKFFDQW